MEQSNSLFSEKKSTLRQLFWYFLIFSIVGLIIETVYCYITTGVLESRKGLLYGPFCPVYGIGASLLIFILARFRRNGVKLFFYGAILGNVIEYLLSYLLEAVYGTRFWDYSYLNFDLNGRISILYSIFWGILSVLLIKLIKPGIDKVLSKFANKMTTSLEIAVLAFLIFDAVLTVWAVTSYNQNAVSLYYKQEISSKPAFISKIEDTLFSDSYMLKTFPNLRFMDKDGEEIYIKTVLVDKRTYIEK